MVSRFPSPAALLTLAALLVLSPAVRAQAPATPPADAPEEEAGQNPLAGKASIGFGLGGMQFLGGQDLKDNANIRPILRPTFKYVWNDRLVTVLEGGFGWNAYGEGGEYVGPDSVGTLATVIPVTLGLDYCFQTSKKIVPRVGAGLGLYSLEIKSGRDVTSRDPLTDRARKASALGGYVKAGFEAVFKPTFTLHTDLLYHVAMTADEDKYPRGWLDENASFVELRAGLNYSFTIRQGGAGAEGEEGEEE